MPAVAFCGVIFKEGIHQITANPRGIAGFHFQKVDIFRNLSNVTRKAGCDMIWLCGLCGGHAESVEALRMLYAFLISVCHVS